MIEDLIKLIKEKNDDLGIDSLLHSQVYSIINRESQLNTSAISEEPKTLNNKSLILVI